MDLSSILMYLLKFGVVFIWVNQAITLVVASVIPDVREIVFDVKNMSLKELPQGVYTKLAMIVILPLLPL